MRYNEKVREAEGWRKQADAEVGSKGRGEEEEEGWDGGVAEGRGRLGPTGAAVGPWGGEARDLLKATALSFGIKARSETGVGRRPR